MSEKISGAPKVLVSNKLVIKDMMGGHKIQFDGIKVEGFSLKRLIGQELTDPKQGAASVTDPSTQRLVISFDLHSCMASASEVMHWYEGVRSGHPLICSSDLNTNFRKTAVLVASQGQTEVMGISFAGIFPMGLELTAMEKGAAPRMRVEFSYDRATSTAFERRK